MAVTYAYFSAPSDEVAEQAIGAGPAASDDAVSTTGFDPTVQLAQLEAELTGLDLDLVMERPRAADTLRADDDGARLVITLSDQLQAALSESSDEQIRAAAQQAWQELAEQADDTSSTTVETSVRLAGLARRASQHGRRLYCWCQAGEPTTDGG